MDKANLPTETAEEPNEEAQQPLQIKTMSGPEKSNPKKHIVSFAASESALEPSQNNLSQNSNSYKDVLSQPAPGLSQRERLLWLQKRRTQGLWVQCDDCDRWRHLPHIIDSHELPKKWYCRMNPDKSLADCSAPEIPIRLRDEEDLVHSEYSAGSIVWGRMPGWPWWPAMVDDCPDNEQFYWLDGFSDIPTHYNVVFFDTLDVTRAWLAPSQMKPYNVNKDNFKHLLQDRKYKTRLQGAISQADDADMLPLPDRLARYSFVARYKGTINRPQKIDKHVLAKFKNQLKRKFNTDFHDDSSSDSDYPESIDVETNKNNNVIILGTPKKVPRKIVPKVLNDLYSTDNKPEVINGSVKPAEVTEKSKGPVEPDSMTVQIGSSEFKNESPTTKILSSTINDSQLKVHVDIESSSSDDFDF